MSLRHLLGNVLIHENDRLHQSNYQDREYPVLVMRYNPRSRRCKIYISPRGMKSIATAKIKVFHLIFGIVCINFDQLKTFSIQIEESGYIFY